MPEDEYWMQQALILADQAGAAGEVPVGALVLAHGRLIGRGANAPITRQDPSAHAEILALREAAQHQGNYRLPCSTLYVTIEPCTMCVGAIIHARIERVVFGAPEPRYGAVVSARRLFDDEQFNHRVQYLGGVLADECGARMRAFFRRRRQSAGTAPID